jgi:hypothetical protein
MLHCRSEERGHARRGSARKEYCSARNTSPCVRSKMCQVHIRAGVAALACCANACQQGWLDEQEQAGPPDCSARCTASMTPGRQWIASRHATNMESTHCRPDVQSHPGCALQGTAQLLPIRVLRSLWLPAANGTLLGRLGLTQAGGALPEAGFANLQPPCDAIARPCTLEGAQQCAGTLIARGRYDVRSAGTWQLLRAARCYEQPFEYRSCPACAGNAIVLSCRRQCHRAESSSAHGAVQQLRSLWSSTPCQWQRMHRIYPISPAMQDCDVRRHELQSQSAP